MKNPLLRWLGAFGARSEELYHRLLGMALGAPWVVVVASVAFAGVAAVIFTQLPEQLTPNEDRGVIPISVNARRACRSASGTQMLQIEAGVGRFASESRRWSVPHRRPQGINSVFVVLTLAPWKSAAAARRDIRELNS